MSIRVTVTDEETGDTDTAVIGHGPDGYVLTCGPGCKLTHTQAYANGTRVLTIKPVRDGLEAERHEFVMDDYDGDCAVCGEGVMHYLHPAHEDDDDGLEVVR